MNHPRAGEEPGKSPKRLHLVLAPKERFAPAGAGAFALNALETTLASRWRDGITVFGTPVEQPFSGVRFQPIALPRWTLRGRNRAMAARYVAFAKRAPPDFIEVFNRPVMASLVARGLPGVPVALHYGNDPRGMAGSRTIGERRTLLAACAAIVCVSDYIRRCFLDGMDDPLAERVKVVHTGVEQPPTFPGDKTRKIVFVGRIVPDKGVLEFVEALARILPQHPGWSAEIIGARWFGNEAELSAYEQKVADAAALCPQIRLSGFKPHAEVIDALCSASIAAVPSCWDDPFPRTVLEALAQGCALVCSNRGGIPEVGSERALFLETISADTLAAALDRLIRDDAGRAALQKRGWNDFPFEIGRTTARLDDLRDALMGLR